MCEIAVAGVCRSGAIQPTRKRGNRFDCYLFHSLRTSAAVERANTIASVSPSATSMVCRTFSMGRQ